MKQGFIKVAAVSPKGKVADVEYNQKKICEKLDEVSKEHAKIVVFPELCITGYTCGDLFFQETLLQKAKEALQEIIDYTEGLDMLVFVGLPLKKNHKLYNVAAAICDGQLLALIPKRYLPGYSEYAENRYFASGKEVDDYYLFEKDGEMMEVPFGTHILLSCAQMDDLVVGCEFGEEAELLCSPSAECVAAGATVLVNLSAMSAGVLKERKLESSLQELSKKLVCGYVMANAGEGESTQDVVMSGCNLICENGEVLGKNKLFSYDNVISEIDVQLLSMQRCRINTFSYEEAKEYLFVNFSLEMEETVLTRKVDKLPFVPKNDKESLEEILEIQARGLMQRLKHIGCKKVVLGISGGLDSTLALLVCAKTFDLLGLDRKGIYAITMPCFGTSGRTYENACKLTNLLGGELHEIDIKKSVMQHFEDIGHSMDNHNVTFENAQARERTQVLMDIANEIGALVVGTGDLSELALGFATYNGDHMSMYGVNGGVTKTLLQSLVKYYGDSCGCDELKQVLYDILDTPISPELLPSEEGEMAQKTEDLVGPYELHDFVLYQMLRYGFSPAKIYRLEQYCFSNEYDKETMKKWMKIFYKRFFAQQYKRSCLPDGVKVFGVSVSPRGDFRMPSDAGSFLWLKEVEEL